MDHLFNTMLIGAGATALLDLWSALRERLLGLPRPDYALVGRWFAHLPRGRFIHRPITATAAVAGERLIGWTVHYLIGVAFAALMLSVYGLDWLANPALGPALVTGISTVVFPLLVLQPGFGAGIAGRRSARPNSVRLHSLINHAVFGLGLYAAGLAVHYGLMSRFSS